MIVEEKTVCMPVVYSGNSKICRTKMVQNMEKVNDRSIIIKYQ